MEKAPLLHGSPSSRRFDARGPNAVQQFLRGLCVILLAINVYSLAFRAHEYFSQRWERASLNYGNEHISWKRCGTIKGHQLECSSVDVPMDQFDSVNSADKTFNIPLVRLRGKNAHKNIVLNPGGPGASGINFIYDFGESLNAQVGEGFHLVSFDPRGVNSSTPVASCYPDDETRKRLSKVRTSDLIRDSPELYAWATNFARACNETLGEHGRYLNTPQTAADMNNILDALGQNEMYYWGFSYGTVLGQTYATLFPDRVGRMVIDGVVDQDGWFEKQVDDTLYVDSAKVLSGFFEECFKSGENCELSGFAKSSTELEAKTKRAINNLRSAPASVYVNSSLWGELTDHKLWYDGVYREIYTPETWPRLAHNLAQLLNGSATDAFIAYGQGDLFAPVGESYRVIALNDAKSGPDYWPQKRLDLLKVVLPFFDKYFFAKAQHQLYYMKQQWSLPRTHNYVPQKEVKTANPLLVLSMRYDPVCPLKSAKGAKQIFAGSRLVEVNGYGHCSLAMPSGCLDEHIRRYFNEGKLPDGDTTCEIDQPYFPARN